MLPCKMRYTWFLRIVVLLVAFTFWDCQPDLDLNQLNGYWQIDYVSQNREVFRPKPGVIQWDYYEWDGVNGFRKKVTPTGTNTFETSADQTSFSILQNKGDYQLLFQTPWDQWEERLLFLDQERLVLEHNIRQYHYLRKK